MIHQRGLGYKKTWKTVSSEYSDDLLKSGVSSPIGPHSVLAQAYGGERVLSRNKRDKAFCGLLAFETKRTGFPVRDLGADRVYRRQGAKIPVIAVQDPVPGPLVAQWHRTSCRLGDFHHSLPVNGDKLAVLLIDEMFL